MMLKRAAVSALAVTALAACSSTVGGHPSAAGGHPFPSTLSDSGTAGSGTAGSGSAGQSGPALITETFSAMKAATAFHAVATGTDSDGAPLSFDVHFGSDTTAGTITESGFTLQVIVVGQTPYFKGDSAFWRNVIPASEQSVALPRLQGKWVTGPASNPSFGEIAKSFSRSGIVDSIQQGDPASDYSVIGRGTRSGVSVIQLRDSGDGSEVDVLASGPPFPVYASTPASSDSGAGVMVFSEWNQPFTASAPPQSEIFDVTPYLH